MTTRTNAMLRVVTGQGLIPRPRLLERLLTMFDVQRTRIDLSRLDDERLRDIALSREEVEAELSRPVWDVPANWRRR